METSDRVAVHGIRGARAASRTALLATRAAPRRRQAQQHRLLPTLLVRVTTRSLRRFPQGLFAPRLLCSDGASAGSVRSAGKEPDTRAGGNRLPYAPPGAAGRA